MGLWPRNIPWASSRAHSAVPSQVRMFGPKVHDDRGRTVPLADLYGIFPRLPPRPMPKWLQNDVIKWIPMCPEKSRWRWVRNAGFLLVAGIGVTALPLFLGWVLTLLLHSVPFPPSHRLSPAMFVLGLFLSLLLTARVLWWTTSKHVARTIATRIVHHRRCGSCVYDIRSTPEEPDGCTVCPECGAAWKLTPQ